MFPSVSIKTPIIIIFYFPLALFSPPSTWFFFFFQVYTQNFFFLPQSYSTGVLVYKRYLSYFPFSFYLIFSPPPTWQAIILSGDDALRFNQNQFFFLTYSTTSIYFIHVYDFFFFFAIGHEYYVVARFNTSTNFCIEWREDLENLKTRMTKKKSNEYTERKGNDDIR